MANLSANASGGFMARRGMLLVWFTIILVALMALISLGVDLGRVQLAKTELQRAADAAARAAAGELPNGVTAARNAAINFAGYNKSDEASVVLTTTDIEFGAWNSSTNTFTVLTGSDQASANAIRVTAHKSASQGTAVPLLFARVLGLNSCNVTASSIAMLNVSSSGYRFAGLNSLTISGHSDSDSYNSSAGAYGGSNQFSNGDLSSNGTISITGNVVVNGDANPGAGYSVSIGKNCSISGSTASLTSPLTYSSVDASSYASNNNNSSVPGQFINGSDFKMNAHDAFSMPGGTYYFNNFTVNGNADLTVSGAVTIYVTGNFTMNGHTSTNGNIPANFKILVQGSGNVAFGGNTDVYAEVYAPLSDIIVSGHSDLYGAAVGSTLKITGNGSLHYDEALNTASGSGNASISIMQ